MTLLGVSLYGTTQPKFKSGYTIITLWLPMKAVLFFQQIDTNCDTANYNTRLENSSRKYKQQSSPRGSRYFENKL